MDREFLFIAVVDANFQAAETAHVGEAYNVGTGESVMIYELAELIREITSAKLEIVHTDPREGDIEHSKTDLIPAINTNPSPCLCMGEHRLSDRSILITGGAGFIGSHLTKALVDDNDVTVYDSLTTGNRANVPDGATFIEADVRDEHELEQAIADTDLLFHEAALVSVAESIETPRESHESTATGTLNVLEAAREHDTRVVLASSAAIYGHPEYTPIDEAHPLHPTSPYGIDKLTADHYTRLYNDLYDLDTVALRYFNVHGPGQTGGDYAGVISVFIEQALNEEPITVHGDGTQTRDFIFVEDVVDANLKAAETDHVGEAYNIGTQESVTIRELAELIRELTDSDSEIVHIDPREGDIKHSEADISKMREKLDYEPAVSLREGLKRTIEWWEND